MKSRPQRHLLRSVFEDLKSWAANKPQQFQGYLVTHAGKPAEPEYIAAQIDYVDKKELKKAMTILHQIGLIERVTLNGQFSATDADCPEGSGNSPDNSGNECDSLNKGRAASAEEASIGLSADEGKEKGQGKGKGKGKEKPPQAPTTAPADADEPTGSDLGGEKAEGRSSPPGTANNADSGLQGGGMPVLGVDYDKANLHYGEQIYDVLKWRGQGKKRESTSFASVWHKCVEKLANSGLSPPEIEGVADRGRRQAEKIARQKGNRAAKWNDFIKNLTDSIVRKYSG
jgi:hypothetical protein